MIRISLLFVLIVLVVYIDNNPSLILLNGMDLISKTLLDTVEMFIEISTDSTPENDALLDAYLESVKQS